MATTFLRNLTASGLTHYYLDASTIEDACRRISLPGSTAATARVARSPHPIPVIPTGIDYPVDAEFANNQDKQPFNFEEGDIRYREGGIWLHQNASVRYSPGTPYRAAQRYYFEEAMFRLDPPFNAFADLVLTEHWVHPQHNHLMTIHADSSGFIHFRTQYYEGATLRTHDWTQSTGDIHELPISTNTQSSWIYYQWVRELDASGNGTATLYVRHQGGEGFLGPALTYAGTNNITDAYLRLGQPSPIQRNWRIAWYRAQGSDDVQVPSVAAVPWSTAVLNEQIIATPSGDNASTWFDSGAAGVYWNIPFPVGLVHVQGSKLEARFAATDTVPAGNLSGLFSGAWTDLVQGTTIGLPGQGLQGRYFLMQLRFTPSLGVPLDPHQSILNVDTSDNVLGAGFRTEPWGAVVPGEPIEITLRGEVTKGSALPFDPEAEVSVEETHLGSSHEMEFPYIRSAALASKPERRIRFSWLLTEAQKDTFLTYLEDNARGEKSFDYNRPVEDGTVPDVGIFASDEYSIRWVDPGLYEVEAEILS